MKKVPFKIEISGHVEIGEISDADVFRHIAALSNWEDLIHDEAIFEHDAHVNRKFLVGLLGSEELLREFIEHIALERLATDLQRYVSGEDVVSEKPILLKVLPRLSSDVSTHLTEMDREGVFFDELLLFDEAFVCRLGKPSVRIGAIEETKMVDAELQRNT